MSTVRTSFIPSTMLATVAVSGPFAQSGPKAWQKLFTWLDRSMHHRTPGRGFGMTIGDPRVLSPEKLKYVAGVEVPEDWSPADLNLMTKVRFDGGAYLLKEHIGPYDELGPIMSMMRNEVERRPEIYLDASRPPVTLFLSDQRVTEPNSQFSQVCVPILADRRARPRGTDEASKSAQALKQG